MRLFDGFAKLHTSPTLETKELRKIMMAASRLYGIGSGLDPKSPQKAARKFLKEMTLPPGWTETEWDYLGYVIRYHRGGLPSEKQKSFSRLKPEEQNLVCVLAGVLRLARSLSKSGVLSAKGMQVERSVDALIVHMPGLAESEENAARLAAGKYLLESSVGQPVIVKAVPPALKIVELPGKEDPPIRSAAASD
jgi:exopolyphosphatase/pppGpp-phosphohydrolase